MSMFLNEEVTTEGMSSIDAKPKTSGFAARRASLSSLEISAYIFFMWSITVRDIGIRYPIYQYRCSEIAQRDIAQQLQEECDAVLYISEARQLDAANPEKIAQNHCCVYDICA